MISFLMLRVLHVPTLLLIALAAGTVVGETKPGVKQVQVSFAELKPVATLEIGGTADWVLITRDDVWVASTKPYAVQLVWMRRAGK